MDKVIVYGLGKKFNFNKEKIVKLYDVVGYCDKDSRKVANIEKGISRQRLVAEIDYIDKVLVTAQPREIVVDLIYNLNIPKEKIEVYEYHLQAGWDICIRGANGEDAVLLLLLESIMPDRDMRDIFYLEIGTNDPVIQNNSFVLYCKGARGVLVDPLVWVNDLVQLSRPEDKVLNIAVSNIDKGSKDFYVCKAYGLSSLHEKHHHKWDDVDADTEIKEVITCEVLGVNTLLSRLKKVPDIVFVDAEGEDYNIVTNIDFDKYPVSVIVMEVEHMTGNKFLHLCNKMKKCGYDLYTVLHYTNAFFYKKNSISYK